MKMNHAQRLALFKKILLASNYPMDRANLDDFGRVVFARHDDRNSIYRVTRTTPQLKDYVSVGILQEHGPQPCLCLYIPTCRNCGHLASEHGPKAKCLFQATTCVEAFDVGSRP